MRSNRKWTKQSRTSVAALCTYVAVLPLICGACRRPGLSAVEIGYSRLLRAASLSIRLPRKDATGRILGLFPERLFTAHCSPPSPVITFLIHLSMYNHIETYACTLL